MRNGLAYLSDGRNGMRRGRCLQPRATDPEAPASPPADTLRGFALRGDWLATAEGDAGVRLFELRRDGRPDETASLPRCEERGTWRCWTGCCSSRRASAVCSSTHWRTAGRFCAPPSSRFVPPTTSAPTGRWRLVSNGTAGLQFLDLSDPAKPLESSTLKIHRNYPTGRVSFAGPYAFVAVDLAGMAVVDLSEHGGAGTGFSQAEAKAEGQFSAGGRDGLDGRMRISSRASSPATSRTCFEPLTV